MDPPRIKKGYFLLNNKKYITRNGINLIGRNREAAVIVKNASISQHHALLVILDDDKHYLSDFNSSNGTFLDSVKLQPLRLYEVKQGASVQFADIKSMYFKVTDNTEINTQGSDSSQVVNDTLFNAKTQLFDSSLQSANKTKEKSHITDHGYTKLLEDDESFLNVASASTGVRTLSCDNHVNEVINDGDSDDANETEEEIQESLTNHMNDHGYHKRTQREDIHDLQTPVINKNIKSSLVGAIHDLPTQIIGGFDNNNTQAQNTSIHELPTQMIHLPDVLETSNLTDVKVSNSSDVLTEKVTSKPSTSFVHELPAHLPKMSEISVPKDLNSDLLKEEVRNEPSTSSVHKLPAHLSNTSENSVLKDLNGDLSKVKVTNEPSTSSVHKLPAHLSNTSETSVLKDLNGDLSKEKVTNEPSTSFVHKLPAHLSNMSEISVPKDLNGDPLKENEKSNEFVTNTSFNEPPVTDKSVLETKCNNSNDVIDETLPDNLQQEENSTDSIDFMTMQGATQHFTDNVSSEDLDTQSKLHVSQQNRKVKYVIDSDDETDVDSEPELRTSKTKRTKKKNVIDSSQESEVEKAGDKVGKVRPVIEDSDSETDAEIDVSEDGKEKPCSNDVSSDKNVNVELEPKFAGTTKVKPIIKDSDSETDDDIDILKGGRAGDGKEKLCLNEVSSVKNVNVESEPKFIGTTKDSDSETFDEFSISKGGRAGDGKEKPCLNTVSSDKNVNVEFEPKVIGTTKMKLIIKDSDSETDDEIDISKDGKEKPCKREVTTDKKTNEKFGSKARPIIEDSDSETDVDIVKDQRTSGAEKDNSLLKRSNERTAETKTNSGRKNVDSNSDSDSELIKVSKKKNVIESSDDTDAESDNLSANQKAKTDSEVDNKILTDPSKADNSSVRIDTSVSTKEAQINPSNNEDNCQQDLFQTTKIDEDKKDDNKNESVNRLDDTDVIPATQNSFVGEIDFDFNTQDLNYAAAKSEKANEEKGAENTLNSEETVGDSFRLALTNSLVEAKHDDGNSTIDVFLQATQKAEDASSYISRYIENESIFLKPTQKIGSKNDGDGDGGDDDNDDIFIQPTQQLSEKQDNSEPSEEIFLQPQIIFTEKRLEAKSKLAAGGSVEEKLESIFRPTQPDDDGIFQEATQILPEKEVTFVKPAPAKNVHKSKLTSKPIQTEDNIFMQATQVISEETGGNVANIEKPDVNLNKEVLEDDDIFIQATQISPEVQNDNKEKTDKDNFVHPTEVVTNELKENPPGHSVESQLEVLFASQNIRLVEDENPRPENPLVNLLSSLKVQSEVIEISDDFPEETSNKENKTNAGPSKKRTRAKSTDSNDDAIINKSKRGSRKSPLLSTDMETIKRNTRSTTKNTEESDVPKVLNEEEQLDLLFKTTNIMENDIFLEFAEPEETPVGRTRRPQPPETHKYNENLKSLRKKTTKSSLATVEEQPELPSKLDGTSTPLENKVSAAGHQLEEEGKLQSKKRNVKSTKRADNVGEGTSSDKVETVAKSERSRRQKAEKDEEITGDIGNLNIHQTPHRSTKGTRNNKIEIMKVNDSEMPLRSDLPSTSKTNTNESADTKKSTRLKDREEITEEKTPHRSTKRTRNNNIERDVPGTSKINMKESVATKKSTRLKNSEEITEEKTPSGKGKIKSKNFKPECDQEIDVKETKRRTKRTNSTANDETEEKSIKNVKRTRFDSTENENAPFLLGSETPSTSRTARSKRTQISATVETDTASDDEFAPSVAKKKRKNVLDSDSDDITSQSSVKTAPRTPARKKLLQPPDNSLSTPERLKRKLKPKVVFTMLNSPELESLIRSLGGSVVDTVEASTVVVTSGVKRSQKLLSAVGLGKPICSAKWLHECRKAGSFLDPWDHILVDDEAEKKWHFSLKESLQRSVDTRLLENYIVHLIVNNAQDVLKGAIESCGGKCVTRAPPKNSTANYVIVSTPENKNKYAKFLKQIPQPMVVAPEAIFDGVLRQELHFKDHKLT